MASMTISIPVSHLVVMPDGSKRFYGYLQQGASYNTYSDSSGLVIPCDLYTAYKLGVIRADEVPDHLLAWWKLTLENN